MTLEVRPVAIRGPLPASPYVGLTPFSEEDAPFFFGRERERRIIAMNLRAARLTLVYGASGVGKSSVLLAGVARDLRVAAESDVGQGRLPESIPVVFRAWRDEPIAGLAEVVAATVRELMRELAPEPAPSETRLDLLFAGWKHRLGERAKQLELETGVRQPSATHLLVILDQFEEYFLYHPDEDGSGTFADEFPRAVKHSERPANFLLSIRDDAYVRLDRFEGEIPNLFANNIRIEHLGRAAAEEAICGPVQQFSRLTGGPLHVEPELVEAVVAQVTTGSVAFGDGPGGVIESDALAAELRVETPFLQLVMERVWAEERRLGSDVLRAETLEQLGGAGPIVRTHVDRAVAALDSQAQDTAARVFRLLVTPSGTKIAYLPSDLAALEELPEREVTEVLESLAGVRIVRSVAPAPGSTGQRYELFHDILASAVLSWRAAWIQARETIDAAERAGRERELVRRLRAALAALAVVTIALIVVLALAFR